MAMKQAEKKRWLKALRSGDYKQAQEALVGEAVKPVYDITFFDSETGEVKVEIVDRVTIDEVGHCCLGVLCDVSPKMTRVTSDDFDENISLDLPRSGVGFVYGKPEKAVEVIRRFDYMGEPIEERVIDETRIHGQELPSKFREYLGITDNEQNKLVHMNDTDDATFAEIADWIEENL